MKSGKLKRAEREGPVRMHWSDDSYSDFSSREEALEHAALAEDSSMRAVSLEEHGRGSLEGGSLKDAVRLRVTAMQVYDLVRLDPRLQEMGIGIARLVWDGDDALFAFRGYGQHQPKKVSADALSSKRPHDIADSLIRWVAMEIEFRRRSGS